MNRYYLITDGESFAIKRVYGNWWNKEVHYHDGCIFGEWSKDPLKAKWWSDSKTPSLLIGSYEEYEAKTYRRLKALLGRP